MEGELLYYSGFVGGFKKIFAQIEGSHFVGKKNKGDTKESLRISLQKEELCEIFFYPKDNQ